MGVRPGQGHIAAAFYLDGSDATPIKLPHNALDLTRVPCTKFMARAAVWPQSEIRSSRDHRDAAARRRHSPSISR